MRFLTLFLTTLLGLAAALPLDGEDASLLTDVSARDNVIESIVRDLLEEIRALILNGSDEIPILDPFQLDHMHLDLGEFVGLDGSHVQVTDAVMNHLSTFEVDHLRITLTSLLQQRYTMELDGHIPSLNIEAGNYDMDVTILGFNVFGNGRLKLRIVEPRVTGTVVLRISLIPLPITAFIETADVGFTLGGFESEFTGLFDGDEFLNDFVSIFLRNLVPELIEFFEEEIRTTLSALIVSIGNDILSNMEVISAIANKNLAQMPELPPLEQVSYPEFVQAN